MAGRARSKSKGRRDGLTLQLPSHVQNSLNKEERMLQQALGDIDRETKHRLKCISQDQQVAARKLSTLERRLLVSQSRSQSAVVGQGERKRLVSRMDTSNSGYFKSLMTPAIKDATEYFEEEQFSRDIGGRPKQSVSGAKPVPKSALKKGGVGGANARGRSSNESTVTMTRRKSVSFHD